MGVHALSNTLDLITIDPWSILVSMCNLLIIFLIIKKFLFKPVMKVIKEREDQIKDQYAKAGEAKKEAEESKAIYSERIRHAEEEADEIIKKAHEDAKRLSSEIVSEADMKADAIRMKAESDIKREKEKAEAELRKEIADISVDIAGKVVGREIEKKDHERFINEFINDISVKDEGTGEEDNG